MNFSKASLEEILEDLSSRFVINVPPEENLAAARIGFQVEEAHWFYTDFIQPLKPSLPNFSLKDFHCKLIKQCPVLHHWAKDPNKYYNEFLSYKLKVPVCGAIILNPTLDKCLLVRGFSNRASWGFPRGKIDVDEEMHLCAIREINEEVGFDVSPYLVKEDCISLKLRDQIQTLYIIPCIPETTNFQTQTRNEIGKISWFPLSIFPPFKPGQTNSDIVEGHNKFFNVQPFMQNLAKWLKKYRKSSRFSKDYQRAVYLTESSAPFPSTIPASVVTEDSKVSKSQKSIDQHPWLDFTFDLKPIMDQFRAPLTPT